MLDAKALEASRAAYQSAIPDGAWHANGGETDAPIRAAITAYLQAFGPEPAVAEQIADAVLDWMVKYDLLDAGNEYGPAEVLAVLNDLAPSERSALVATPPAEPDFAASIAETITEECAAGAACGWRSCTGCHETNEGAETGHYPYSKMFGCHVGSGCSECGGLGVVWEHWSEDSLNEMAADVSAPTPPAERVVEALPNWNGWRSIDTAPEDCRVILATAGGWVGEAIMLRDEDTGEQVWTWVDTGKPSLHSCYGWMPLPAPLVAPVLSDLRPDGFDGPTGAE